MGSLDGRGLGNSRLWYPDSRRARPATIAVCDLGPAASSLGAAVYVVLVVRVSPCDFALVRGKLKNNGALTYKLF